MNLEINNLNEIIVKVNEGSGIVLKFEAKVFLSFKEDKSARFPKTKASPPSRMDLPAPVSPVSTFKPDLKSNESRSIIRISRISRLLSIFCPNPAHADQSH